MGKSMPMFQVGEDKDQVATSDRKEEFPPSLKGPAESQRGPVHNATLLQSKGLANGLMGDLSELFECKVHA